MRWPQIIMRVNSVDEWNRFKIEGYGFLEFPRQPGYYKSIKVPTWRPAKGDELEVHKYFLGGSIKMKDAKDISNASFKIDYEEDTVLNRMNTSSYTAGDIFLSVNVITQSM